MTPKSYRIDWTFLYFACIADDRDKYECISTYCFIYDSLHKDIYIYPLQQTLLNRYYSREQHHWTLLSLNWLSRDTRRKWSSWRHTSLTTSLLSSVSSRTLIPSSLVRCLHCISWDCHMAGLPTWSTNGAIVCGIFRVCFVRMWRFLFKSPYVIDRYPLRSRDHGRSIDISRSYILSLFLC